MTNKPHRLNMHQRGVLADLLNKSIDYIVLPEMPNDGDLHEDAGIAFDDFIPGGNNERISLWVPLSTAGPITNPPVLRRFIEFRGRDLERWRLKESFEFPEVAITYHVISVKELGELGSLISEFESALKEAPYQSWGIPKEWWYTNDQPEVLQKPQIADTPWSFRTVDLISHPLQRAYFYSYEDQFRGLNRAFETCWSYLQMLCSTPAIEGVAEHYYVDPYRYARLLLEGTID